MCTIELQKAYHGIIAVLWPMFKADLTTAPTITGSDDPRWVEICDRYEGLVDKAPKEVRDYMDSQVRVHIYELEKMWRWENDRQTA